MVSAIARIASVACFWELALARQQYLRLPMAARATATSCSTLPPLAPTGPDHHDVAFDRNPGTVHAYARHQAAASIGDGNVLGDIHLNRLALSCSDDSSRARQ